jgi:hypothetical protein
MSYPERCDASAKRQAIEFGITIPARRVIAVLEELLALHGAPRAIRCDNGQELTSLARAAW